MCLCLCVCCVCECSFLVLEWKCQELFVLFILGPHEFISFVNLTFLKGWKYSTGYTFLQMPKIFQTPFIFNPKKYTLNRENCPKFEYVVMGLHFSFVRNKFASAANHYKQKNEITSKRIISEPLNFGQIIDTPQELESAFHFHFIFFLAISMKWSTKVEHKTGLECCGA